MKKNFKTFFKKALAISLIFTCIGGSFTFTKLTSAKTSKDDDKTLTTIITDNNDGTSKYELPQMFLKLDIPNDRYTFTRDVNEKTPNIDKLSSDLKTYKENLNNSNVYLNSLDKNKTSEIIITMMTNRTSSHYYDFNLYDNAKMEEFAKEVINSQNNADTSTTDDNAKKDENAFVFKYTNHSIYKQKEANFLVFELSITQKNKTIYSKQYSTIINGQMINLTINSTSKELSSNDAKVLDNIVNSMHFTQIKEKPKQFLSPTIRIIILFTVGILIGIVIIRIRNKRKNRPVHAIPKTASPKSPKKPLIDSKKSEDDLK